MFEIRFSLPLPFSCRASLGTFLHFQGNSRHSLNKHGQNHFAGAAPTHGELVTQRSGAQGKKVNFILKCIVFHNMNMILNFL